MITLKAYYASREIPKMEMILGKRSNYVIGMRYGPKPTKNQGSSTYYDEYVHSLESRLERTEEVLATQKKATEDHQRATQEQIEKVLEAKSQEFTRKLLKMQQMFLTREKVHRIVRYVLKLISWYSGYALKC